MTAVLQDHESWLDTFPAELNNSACRKHSTARESAGPANVVGIDVVAELDPNLGQVSIEGGLARTVRTSDHSQQWQDRLT